MIEAVRREIADQLNDLDGLCRAVARSRVIALRHHAIAGRQVPIWQNDRVEWILPNLDELNAELASLMLERGAASQASGG